MKLTREHFRAIIYHNSRRSLTQQECFDELNALYGDAAPTKATIHRLFGEFNRSRRLLTDAVKKVSSIPNHSEIVQEALENVFCYRQNMFSSFKRNVSRQKKLFGMTVSVIRLPMALTSTKLHSMTMT